MASASSPVATPRIKRLPGYSGATSPGYTLTLSFISPMQFEQLWLVDGPNKPTHDLGYGVRNSRARSVLHYLMVDAYYIWWRRGKSYLCRILDMLHTGYVDEISFGRVVTERLLKIVTQWIATVKAGLS